MTLNCGDCLERLYSYLDQELTPEDVVEVKKHLDACGHCSESFVFEENFLAKVRESCTGCGAPTELRERIILRLRSTESSTH